MSALQSMLDWLRGGRGTRGGAPDEWPISADVRTEELSSAFTEAFGEPPSGVWRAPGRVNLMGEHTDYNDGLVLPIALPWGVSLALAPNTSGSVELRSAQRPGEAVRFSPADLHPDSSDATGWAGYVAGVFWAARESGHLDPGVGARILLDSDLPVGASLSSSAAVECAALLALVDTFGLDELGRDRAAMARTARRAENEFVGAPTGIMDQSASLRCTEGRALFLDCRTGGARTLPLPLGDAGLRLLLVDTRVRHRLSDAGSGYAARRAECERAARQLGVDALRDVEDLTDALGALPDPVLSRRVKHVVTEINRVNATVGLIRAGALPEIGPVFNASHLSLRDQFEVSCPELDVAVEAAVGAGARGARMTGGGFGGTAVALVAEDRLADVRNAVSAAFARRRWREPEFRDALPSAGAGRLA
ncbi:galactokinase [Lipingzhangella halophila]|uniref:Galactokinase n=1 Tax=Lipingzhangella halophila TaxID=1783352 RepID=A0A7W7RL46_9ACTN|nr:galactokinase [Lipingzhangella halophila]MBB4933980.1 galactokinase [Lipingzhangella halophila]